MLYNTNISRAALYGVRKTLCRVTSPSAVRGSTRVSVRTFGIYTGSCVRDSQKLSLILSD